jgi:hypothetical protein
MVMSCIKEVKQCPLFYRRALHWWQASLRHLCYRHARKAQSDFSPILEWRFGRMLPPKSPTQMPNTPGRHHLEAQTVRVFHWGRRDISKTV